MNTQTLVAVYDTAAHADAAVLDLRAENVPAEAITQHARNDAMPGSRTDSTPVREQGFWASLFGGEPDHDTAVYDRSIESGSTVVTVRANSDQYDMVSAILEKHHPIDLDERAAQYGSPETMTTGATTAPGMGTRDTAAAAMGGGAALYGSSQTATTRATTAPAIGARGSAAAETDGDKIQLSEESLSVGKRAVSGGTTRIRKYVVETPVEEEVNLHSEKVTIERRPVTDGRPVADASFADKTIEMTEMSEEPVVSKTARVTEEIGLRKEASDRVETVKGTVRREEAKVEKIPGGRTETTRTSETPSAMPPQRTRRG